MATTTIKTAFPPFTYSTFYVPYLLRFQAANAGDKKAAELTSFLQNANKSREVLGTAANHHNHLLQLGGGVGIGPPAAPGVQTTANANHNNSLLHAYNNNNQQHKKTSRKKWKQLAKNAFSTKKSSSCSSRDLQNGSNGGNGAVVTASSCGGMVGGDHQPTLDCCSSYWLEGKAQNVDFNDLTLLQLLALNSLELSAPASDVLLKNRSNSWFQLSGHEGSFAVAGPGSLWKKRGSGMDTEVETYEQLMKETEACRDLVPKFYRCVEYQSDHFIEMQDLLFNFKNPAIMDIKMGTRTFLESEVQNLAARKDLYEKMVKVDPAAPTPEERETEAITKLRYMQFREDLSSSSTLGFRIEGYKKENQLEPSTEFKLVRSVETVTEVMNSFLSGDRQDKEYKQRVCKQFLEKVKRIRTKFQQSDFFKNHEVIGSSLLLIYDSQRVGVWMIDFAKTVPVPENVTIDHRSKWVLGNHEDGYLFGLDNLIKVLESCDDSSSTIPETSSSSTPV